MPWSVTLAVTGCGSAAPLPGVFINDGAGGVYTTNSYGQFIAVISDEYTGYIVQLSKSGYVSNNFAFSIQQNGTVQKTCLNAAPPSTPPTGGSGGCFIVSAATGTPDSAEVEGLRGLRDRVAARSSIAAQVIDSVYAEYERFAPQLATEVETSGLLRQAVLSLVVRPLSAWYELAGQLALQSKDAAATAAYEAKAAQACPRYLRPATVSEKLEAIARGESLALPLPYGGRVAEALHQAMALPTARWALFEPLQLLWSAAAERRAVTPAVASWLARTPVEGLRPPAAGDLERELASFGSLLAFDPDARRCVGERLAGAWPMHRPEVASHLFVPGD